MFLGKGIGRAVSSSKNKIKNCLQKKCQEGQFCKALLSLSTTLNSFLITFLLGLQNMKSRNNLAIVLAKCKLILCGCICRGDQKFRERIWVQHCRSDWPSSSILLRDVRLCRLVSPPHTSILNLMFPKGLVLHVWMHCVPWQVLLEFCDRRGGESREVSVITLKLNNYDSLRRCLMVSFSPFSNGKPSHSDLDIHFLFPGRCPLPSASPWW